MRHIFDNSHDRVSDTDRIKLLNYIQERFASYISRISSGMPAGYKVVCQRGIMWINPFSAGTVFRSQNLTSKDGPTTERIDFLMAVDP